LKLVREVNFETDTVCQNDKSIITRIETAASSLYGGSANSQNDKSIITRIETIDWFAVSLGGTCQNDKSIITRIETITRPSSSSFCTVVSK